VIFKKVKKVKPRAAWTGSQKRIPSNQPPVALKPAKVTQNFEERPDSKRKNYTKKTLSDEVSE
jgi:cell division protease FtsH